MSTSQVNKANIEQTKPPSLLWHGLAFNLVWFLIVVMQWGAVAAMLTVIWFSVAPPRSTSLKLIVGFASIGIIADFAFINAGLLTFNDLTINPLWLSVLWIGFARFAFVFLQHWPLSYWQLALISAVSGPLSYYIGHLNQAVIFDWQLIPQILFFVLFWAGLMPMAQRSWRKFS
ncbi:DUF2878 domain-containing protein [Thalassotalea mangrovi]|uniref:DUF2878 domain-containing protein n=1 Tax=Thalassotalea mangrovi TaxID=2572245 RepID=A0A4V5NX61_9GAMM|nr:DUF2878 domain-containing protein [Thalassotalea mangrovi]TKB47141.1 DUF2878 domain-containing protein [Thalassotalea mangrovi]